jgi:hypothetical protein
MYEYVFMYSYFNYGCIFVRTQYECAIVHMSVFTCVKYVGTPADQPVWEYEEVLPSNCGIAIERCEVFGIVYIYKSYV